MKKNDDAKKQPVIPLSEFQQLQGKSVITDTEYHRMKALYDVVRAASSSLDLQETLELALRKVMELTSSDSGICYLLDTEERILSLRVQAGLPEKKSKRTAVLIERDELHRLLQWKSPCQEPSEMVKHTTLERMLEPLERKKTDPYLIVPFTGRKCVIALMVLVRRAGDTYSKEDLALTGAIGAETGLCFENALSFENISRLATREVLTGLYNQSFFLQRLNEEIQRSARYGQKCSLIMLELVDLDVFNNIIGYPVSDDALKATADCLQGCLRHMDIACRYGSTSFAVILPETGSRDAYQVAERIRHKLRMRSILRETLDNTSLAYNIGVTSFPGDAPSPEGLLRRIEIALGAAKQKGGNRTVQASDVLGTIGSAKRSVWEVAEYLEAAGVNTIYGMAAAIDARDPCTSCHSRNVAGYAVTIGKALHLPSGEMQRLRSAALVHDIGKIGIPDSIINKSDAPSEEEWEQIHKHPELGAVIVSHMPDLVPCAAIVRHHHEWYNGNGYPDGLAGYDIPPEARIIAVAEAYDAMINIRSYHQPLLPDEAIEELRRCSGNQFDPAVVNAFISTLE